MKHHITIILAAALSILTVHAGDVPQTELAKSKLEAIILPDINFENTPISSAVAEIRKLANSSDTLGNEERKGVNIVLKIPESSYAILITASLKHPTLGQALTEIAKKANCKIIVEAYAISIIPQDG